jgi:hypothetical protein
MHTPVQPVVNDKTNAGQSEHPSWLARKQMRADMTTLKPQGKKVVFSDNDE